MLSLAKLRPGGQQYYLDSVARGLEEYYTGAKEAPGQWVGHGALLLGLDGTVDEEPLHRVLSHRDPTSGTRVTRGQGAPKIPGFDAAVNDPKSVSLLFALGPPDVSNEVRNAHDAAVAAFRHRTSRAGDPHLHTHVLIANLVHSRDDGRWRALDARPLYGWARTAGFVHEAQLRAELTRRRGVEWGPVHKGIAEMAGMPRSALRAFSRRRVEIEVQLEEWGETSARAAQAANYQTRRPKDREGSVEGLLPEWRRRAETVGITPAAIGRLLGRGTRVWVPTPSCAEAEVLFAALASPDGLTAKASTFGRREVLQAICSALPNGGRHRRHRRARGGVSRLRACPRPRPADGDAYQRRDPPSRRSNDPLLRRRGPVLHSRDVGG